MLFKYLQITSLWQQWVHAFKKLFRVRQMSDKILLLSVKHQILKRRSGCRYLHRPLLSSPGDLFFLFFFGSNSLQACVPYLCKQTTGKSKNMASPNLSILSRKLQSSKGAPETPPTDFPSQAVFTQKSNLHDLMWPAQQRWSRLYQMTKSSQSCELIYNCSQNETDSTDESPPRFLNKGMHFAFNLFIPTQIERNETSKDQKVSIRPMLWPVPSLHFCNCEYCSKLLLISRSGVLFITSCQYSLSKLNHDHSSSSDQSSCSVLRLIT